MMVASVPPMPVARKTRQCAVSRESAVMAITVKRLRIAHAIFVKGDLKNEEGICLANAE